MKRSIWLAIFVAACGGAPSTPVHPSPSSEVPSPPSPWAQMDHEARAGWMRDEVLPRMTTLFQDYDSQRYADFSCATCHGPSPQERNFHMPSASLPALYPTGSPEQQRMVATYERACTFMFSSVRPTMQTLLGAEEYNAETQTGFSCYSCHPHAGDAGTTPIHLTAQ